jgi:hypothetical protein
MDGDDISDQMVVPPNSIAGKIEEIVCWKKPASPSPSTAPQSDSNNGVATLEDAEQNLANVMQDPSKVRMIECIGVNPWQVKPAGWTPPTKEECIALGVPTDAITVTAEPETPPPTPSPSTAPTLWSGSTSVSPPPPKRDIRTIQHDDGVSKQGDVTIFDMNTIQVAPDGSITVLTSSGPPNTGFFDGILVMVHLDCQGHVALDEKDRALPKWVSMRPNSVAGKIADIVCRSRKP